MGVPEISLHQLTWLGRRDVLGPGKLFLNFNQISSKKVILIDLSGKLRILFRDSLAFGVFLYLFGLLDLLKGRNKFGHKLSKTIGNFLGKLLSLAAIFVLSFIKHFEVLAFLLGFPQGVAFFRIHAQQLSEGSERVSNLGRVGTENRIQGEFERGSVENFGKQNG